MKNDSLCLKLSHQFKNWTVKTLVVSALAFCGLIYAEDGASPSPGEGNNVQVNARVSTDQFQWDSQIPAGVPRAGIPRLPGPPGVQEDPGTGNLPVDARADSSVFGGPDEALAPPLIRNYNGFDDTGWYPPDPIIAVGPNHVIVMVNSSWAIYTKNGVLQFSATLDSWFAGVSPPGSPFDPKVVYDKNAGRWVMLALARGGSSGSSYMVSVSDDSDPNGSWWNWNLNASLDGSNPTANWADFPGLGYDSSEAVYLTSNQYTFSDAFQYAKLRILYKSQLYWVGSGGGVSWYDIWNPLDADGVKVFTWKPAQAQSALSGNYLIDTRWSGSSSVTLWRLTNPLGVPPTITRQATVSVGAYSPPGGASQFGGSALIDTGDCRTQEVLYNNGKLATAWVQFYDWGSGPVSAIRALLLNAAASTVDHNVIYGAGSAWYFYPAIIYDSSGNLGMVFSRSSASEYAGSRYSVKLTSDASWQGSSSLKDGQAYYPVDRWGDYAGAALDPVTSSFWIFSEYSRPFSSWGTWIGEVPLGAIVPGNDLFANRFLISGGNGSTTGSSVGATKESGEPNHAGDAGGASVWWEWTAPASGNVTFNTEGSGFDTLLAVYTGTTVGSLSLVASDDDSGAGTTSLLSFSAVAGTSYKIAVDGFSGASGAIQLNWTTPVPDIRIDPLSLSFSGTPPPFDFTPEASGNIRINNVGGAPRLTGMSASPHLFRVFQPNGTPVDLFIRGGVNFHWMEDEKGFTVVREGDRYVYATLDKAGRLSPTPLMVGGGVRPELSGLKPGILPSRDVRQQLLTERLLGAQETQAPTAVPPLGTVKNVVILMRFSNHTGRTLPQRPAGMI